MKIFTLIEFDNLYLFVDKIQDNKKSKNDFKLEDFYDLILNITKYTSLITNYFKFIYDNKEKEKILNFIFDKIKNEKKIFFYFHSLISTFKT